MVELSAFLILKADPIHEEFTRRMLIFSEEFIVVSGGRVVPSPRLIAG